MTQNVGGIERILRIIAGLAILAWGFLLSDPINIWGAIGAIPLITGLISYCPLWSIFGINTKKTA
jgi:sulfite exporter TauE/SafE